MSAPRQERLACPIARDCGGCALIDRPYESQLELKRRRVADALAVHPGLAGVEIEPCLPAPVRAGYRNRAKLAVSRESGALRIGLFRRGTREVIDLAPCLVQSSWLIERLEPIRAWLTRHALAAPDGPVKHLDLRETDDGGGHLTLVLDRAVDDPAELSHDSLLESWPALSGLSINVNPRSSSFVFGETTRTIHGSRSFVTRGFEVPATGFFQVAPLLLEPIHQRMAEHLGADRPLLDLYCGVGVHGLSVASRLPRSERPLSGIEIGVAAAACARRNADRMGIPARFACGAVEKRLAAEIEREEPGRVILNPGRAGCHDSVPAKLGALPLRAAYLSCEPETLARDLDRFVRAGRRVERVLPLDMMPQTDQTEALALLS